MRYSARKKLTNETIRRAIDIPKTTHRRIWKNDDPQMHMDLDVAVHASIFPRHFADEVPAVEKRRYTSLAGDGKCGGYARGAQDTINDLTAELDGLRQKKLTTSAEEVEPPHRRTPQQERGNHPHPVRITSNTSSG